LSESLNEWQNLFYDPPPIGSARRGFDDGPYSRIEMSRWHDANAPMFRWNGPLPYLSVRDVVRQAISAIESAEE
jgi:hypothetical protein